MVGSPDARTRPYDDKAGRRGRPSRHIHRPAMGSSRTPHTSNDHTRRTNAVQPRRRRPTPTPRRSSVIEAQIFRLKCDACKSAWISPVAETPTSAREYAAKHEWTNVNDLDR